MTTAETTDTKKLVEVDSTATVVVVAIAVEAVAAADTEEVDMAEVINKMTDVKEGTTESQRIITASRTTNPQASTLKRPLTYQ